MDLFRVRLNCIDHYQATPTRYDPQLRNDIGPAQAKKGPKVPVVRVFGSTETGQKVCAHIHGAFPYLYVEYQGSLEPEDGKCILSVLFHITISSSVQWERTYIAFIFPLIMPWLSAIGVINMQITPSSWRESPL